VIKKTNNARIHVFINHLLYVRGAKQNIPLWFIPNVAGTSLRNAAIVGYCKKNVK
jgi:hypothetical protein